MAKINQKEYEVLKSLEDEWKWVAKDSGGGGTYTYQEKPYKRKDTKDWCDGSIEWLNIDNRHFQFVQWEDEEPYSIADLIEEYEKDYKGSWEHAIEFRKELRRESEETEVKKDKKWLVDKWTKERNETDVHDPMYQFASEFIADINQLDETETLSVDREQLVKKIENYIPLHDKTVGDVVDGILEIVKQLPEMEVLSPEWIDENKTSIDQKLDGTPIYKVREELLQNLLVPKQELPVIPQIVADYIEKYKGWNDDKELYDEDNAVDLFGAMDLDNAGMSDKVHDYLVDNQETFARAWLNGFMVKKEQKYHALIKGHENIVSDDKYWNYCITDESLDIGDNKVHTDVLAEYVLSATKDEWENLGISDDNADFVKVEEMEK